MGLACQWGSHPSYGQSEKFWWWNIIFVYIRVSTDWWWALKHGEHGSWLSKCLKNRDTGYAGCPHTFSSISGLFTVTRPNILL